jgi:hypothetical protein
VCWFWQDGSSIKSNSNLGMHGQGLLSLVGLGDCIKAQRLFLSLFYDIYVSDSFQYCYASNSTLCIGIGQNLTANVEVLLQHVLVSSGLVCSLLAQK